MNKRIWIASIGIAMVVIVLSVLILPWGVQVRTAPGQLSLSIGMNQAQADELSDWTIKFEPSGTHIKNGYLKVRLDFYPSPDSLSWERCYLYTVDTTSQFYIDGYKGKLDENGDPVDEKDYNLWYDSLPRIWQLSPALCHFIIVPPDVSKADIENYTLLKFNADVIATLDNALIQTNSIHLITSFVSDKSVLSASKIAESVDKITLISDVNTRLSALSISGDADGIAQVLTPHSIDVGTDNSGNDNLTSSTNTRVDKNNPANATGSITSINFYITTQLTSVEAASFAAATNDLTTNDSETIGTLAAGSPTTVSGLDMAITTGDYIGLYFGTGSFRQINNSGGGLWSASGDKIPCTAQAFTLYTNRSLCIYGTGTESGGTPSLTNTPSSKDMGTLWMERTYYAKGTAPNNPVEVGDCTFTITNDGSITENVTISITNLTGGTTWTPVSGSPGASEYRITFYYTGLNPASGVVGSTSSQAFYNGLAASANITWDFKFETGTWTNGDTTQRTGTIQLTAITP